MTTRGKKTNIDPSLIPHTRAELRDAKKIKELHIKNTKDQQEAEKIRKATTAQRHIAQVEDERFLEQANRQSLRPDLDLEQTLPPKSRSAPKAQGTTKAGPGE